MATPQLDELYADTEPAYDPSGIPPMRGEFDSQNITSPFQNAYRGPAGEYSDAYKAIVNQYRDEVDAANRFYGRPEQYDVMRQPIPLPVNRYGRPLVAPAPRRDRFIKSGEDIVDADTGTVIHQGPQKAPAIPHVDPGAKQWLLTMEREHAKAVSEGDLAKANTLANSIEATRRKWNIGLQVPPLNPSEAILAPPSPQPAALIPQARTPRFYAGPNTGLDAPPSTTQAVRVLDRDAARQILDRVGGDKAKARALALQLGYSLQ